MAEKTVEPRKPKHSHYRVVGTDEVLPALRTPAGYEDDHPKEYEPVDAPAAAADTAPVPPKPAVASVAPVAPVAAAPAAPAPQA